MLAYGNWYKKKKKDEKRNENGEGKIRHCTIALLQEANIKTPKLHENSQQTSKNVKMVQKQIFFDFLLILFYQLLYPNLSNINKNINHSIKRPPTHIAYNPYNHHQRQMVYILKCVFLLYCINVYREDVGL